MAKHAQQAVRDRAGKALVVWIGAVCLIGVGVWLGIRAMSDKPADQTPRLKSLFRVPADRADAVILSGMVHSTDMQGFLGAQACRECHADKYETYLETAHAHTSAPPTKETIRGHFTGEKRFLRTSKPELTFEMEYDGNSWLQRGVAQDERGRVERQEKIDVITGSGKIAQTFLYFRDKKVLELPVSYLRVSDSWINSPGYVDGEADFSRQVSIGCLECHSTCVTSDPAFPEDSDRPYKIIYGISCERCHGPGRDHVTYHRENPNDKVAKHVIQPATLSQRRQLDVCGQCHGGEPEGYLSPGFSYRPGMPLQTHVRFRQPREGDAVGVHSTNQAARLASSLCFQKSEGMTCTTCHNPHVLERGDLLTFSNRCLSCHETEDCGVSATLGDRINQNCIDCHLPILEDMGTPFSLPSGETYYPRMRDHAIKIYPELSEELMPKFQDMPAEEKPAEKAP